MTLRVWKNCLSVSKKCLPNVKHSIPKFFCCENNLLRLNHSPECETAINDQINLELYASYVYFSVAYEFDRDTLALPGFHKMFLRFAKEEITHAEKLISYQNKRGGKIIYADLKAPALCDLSASTAVLAAIKLEKEVTRNLEDIHKKGEKNFDYHFCDFIASEFLTEQYKSIKELCDLYTNIKRVGNETGLYIIDQELLNKYK